MKFVLCVFIFIALILLSCNRSDQENELPMLYGKWNLVVSSGGIDGRIIETDKNAPGEFPNFIKPNILETYQGDSLISSRQFSLIKELSIYSSDSLYFIVYAEGFLSSVIYSLTEEHLALADNAYDGFTSEYKRVK